jgi:hypothetical protein
LRVRQKKAVRKISTSNMARTSPRTSRPFIPPFRRYWCATTLRAMPS